MRHPGRATLALLVLAGCNGPDTQINQLVPNMVVAPTAVEFGDVVVLYDADTTVQISNADRADLEIYSIYVDGDTDGVYALSLSSVEELPRDESVPLEINFTPATYLEYNYELVFETNDPEKAEYRIPITGEGVDGPIPDIDVSPGSQEFDTVTVGNTASATLQVKNVGDGDLFIDSVTQSGSGAFELPFEMDGAIISPGNTYPLQVNYTPTIEGGDNGTITITSNDPDEPSVDIPVLGNGGGDYEYPVAEIDCPTLVYPPVRLQLDGTGSHDPNDTDGTGELTYAWSIDQRPNTSVSELSNANRDVASLFVDVAGTWRVSLKVTNEIDLVSAPAECEFEAVPDDLVQIELTWDTGNSDMDLHLVQSGSQFFEDPGDCCYCNPNPSWGESGTADDPDLSLDNRVGYGPEVISMLAPYDGEYYVRAHYFEDKGGGATIATVKVYLNGTEAWSDSKTMEHNEVWDVGFVRWPAAVFVPETTDLYKAGSTRDCFFKDE